MTDPIGLLRTVIRKEMDAKLGGASINSSMFMFGSAKKPTDFSGFETKSNFVSDDQTKRWFFMGISTWGSSDDLVSE